VAKKTETDDEAFDRIFRIAVEHIGSEEQVRAMLDAGIIKFQLGRPRHEPREPCAPCGAYARSTGKPCQAPGNGRGGRCKLHGGKSTGPRTKEGRQRLKEAIRARWRAWRASRGKQSEA
jgi:hypothetical protein